MRNLWWLVIVALVACGGKDDKNNESAIEQVKKSPFNGFWIDERTNAGVLTVLIYAEEVYARDSESGYYGSTSFDGSTSRSITMNLNSYALANPNDADSVEFITNVSATPLSFKGSLFDSGDRYIQGNFNKEDKNGLILNNDETWQNLSSLGRLSGKWTANEFQLSIDSNGRFYANIPESDVSNNPNPGCRFEGKIDLLDSKINLYKVKLSERLNCSAFNKPAEGYARINSEGELEFYLRGGANLLFLTFTSAGEPNTPPNQDTPQTPDDDSGSDDSDSDADENAPAP